MILVVDDDQDIVNMLAQTLKREGYRVETATDGVQAYEHLKDPDCKGMILDVNMPRINGVELLMLMQAESIAVPTIVMAGFEDYDDAEMKNFSNVMQFFHKPFELEEMIAAVRCYARPTRSTH